MLPKLKINDVVVAEDLRVYYFKDNKPEPSSMTLFSTSKEDAYESLFSDPQNYFKHIVSNDHNDGAQYITDNLDLVLGQGSNLHKTGEYPLFDHYAKDINTEVAIQYGVNVASCNDKKVLFIKNLSSHQCRSLYNKIIKLHKVLQ